MIKTKLSIEDTLKVHKGTYFLETKKPELLHSGFQNLAPQPGLEPGTYGLTVRCSTN